MARLELHNLSKRYGDHAAVAGVTLDVPDGEFLVLLGPSGCGKTTTLRMIAGFVEPSGGTATIGGTDVTHLPPWRRNTGMVFQSYALFPHMTVAENVAFGLEMRKLARPEIAARAKVTSLPPRWISPEVGSSRPAIMRSVVVLPQPEGPSRQMNSPLSTTRSMPSTETTSP